MAAGRGKARTGLGDTGEDVKKEAVCGASFLVGSRLLSPSNELSQTGRRQQQTGSSRFRGWEGPAQGAAAGVWGGLTS